MGYGVREKKSETLFEVSTCSQNYFVPSPDGVLTQRTRRGGREENTFHLESQDSQCIAHGQ